MADFDVSRFRTTSFMTIWDLLKEVLVNMVKWFDGTTDTNLPVGTKRWSSSNKRFEQWDGSAWGELLPVADSANAYQIRVAMANACSGSTATADLATNAQNLGGVPAAQYVQTTDTRLSDSRKCNGQFDSAGTARTALSVYSKTEMDNSMALKAPVLNPAFSGTPTAPTAAEGTSTGQIATTAFVANAAAAVAESKTSYGAWVDLSSYINRAGYWGLTSGSGCCRARAIYQDGAVIAYEFDIDLSRSSGVETLAATFPDPYQPVSPRPSVYGASYYNTSPAILYGYSFGLNASNTVNRIIFKETMWLS